MLTAITVSLDSNSNVPLSRAPRPKEGHRLFSFWPDYAMFPYERSRTTSGHGPACVEDSVRGTPAWWSTWGKRSTASKRAECQPLADIWPTAGGTYHATTAVRDP